MSAIRLIDLTKRYGDTVVVDGLDLEVGEGEVFGLLGPNGAGKTTTVLMLLGLTEPSSGSIDVLGFDPRRHPIEVKSSVGYVPDAVGFYDNLTGRQNLRFTARLNRIERPEDEIQQLVDQVGLTEAADRPVGEYSRGMKQRLGLADALVKRPSILVLDEPTTAIDPEGVSVILELIRRLAVEQRVSILLSSHLLNQVQTICDRVAIFHRGRVVAEGPPHELAAAQVGNTRVEFRFAEGAPTRILAGMQTVEAVEHGHTPGSWIVTMDAGSLPATIRLLVESDAQLLGVRRIDEDLDSIYRRQFAAQEPPS